MTDKTNAVARMLETIDLLGKVTASISDRLDQQEQQVETLTALVKDCRIAIGDVHDKVEASTMLEASEAELLHLALDDLKQKTRNLDALYTEADRYFDQVKKQRNERSSLQQNRWFFLLGGFLCFLAGLSVGVFNRL